MSQPRNSSNVGRGRNWALKTEMQKKGAKICFKVILEKGIVMTQTTPVTLDQALEMVELLPVEDQNALLEILQKRHKAKLHDEFVAGVKQSELDFAEGRFISGDAKTIMEALLK